MRKGQSKGKGEGKKIRALKVKKRENGLKRVQMALIGLKMIGTTGIEKEQMTLIPMQVNKMNQRRN